MPTGGLWRPIGAIQNCGPINETKGKSNELPPRPKAEAKFWPKHFLELKTQLQIGVSGDAVR